MLGNLEMNLRAYQSEAISALWSHVRERDDNPCIVLPTGGGKGVILAQIAKDVVGWGGRLIILAHVRELLSQTYENIQKLAPDVSAGIYSAGLGSRDVGYPVTVAGIQSVYDKAEILGRMDIIAIDEAHRIPADGEGMYQTFLEAARKLNPKVVLVGLTATPYRMDCGMICEKDHLLNHICYSVGIRQLIVQGYLSPIKSKTSIEKTDISSVHLRGGEFIQSELQAVMVADTEKVIMACSEIVGKTEDRKSVLVFATGVDHANQVAQFIRDISGLEVGMIFGDTPSEKRAATIESFRGGKLKYLVNVEVLTTGFDAPAVDCVAILRPTMSPGLFYQMCGRGFRLAANKADCLILDFGDNLLRHGPVDRLIISEDSGRGSASSGWKECQNCQEVVARSCEVCPGCGNKFETKERGINHSGKANEASALSEPEMVHVVSYRKHVKAGAPEGHPPTLRVTYACGLTEVSEFICLEHKGFARQKAERWWHSRSNEPVPATIDTALSVISKSGIKEPKRLMLETDGKYLRVERAMELELNPRPMIIEGGIYEDRKAG